MPAAVVSFLLALVVVACPLPAAAQAAGPGEPPPDATEAEEPPAAAAGEEEAPEGERLVPELNVYFPEGELDIRINRLVKKVFAEGQVKYNFVDGDISAFLRYRYYGYARTYQLSVFDEIEFEDIEDFSNDFDRVRGILLLTEWPHSFHHRTFLLTELDRISSNKEEFVFDTGRSNLFLRLGYQIGTPHDERSNAIVGENRARVERLFTAFRQIGPGDAGLTGALTWGTDLEVGDFDYVKLEFSGLKRFELPRGAFLFGRLHGGTFLRKAQEREIDPDSPLPVTGRFLIPREEFFRLDGRDNLKGLDERLRGTEEIHNTWEMVYPWFVGQDHEYLKLNWENWYWVLYGGVGTIGFDRDVLTEFDDYVADVGVGFEASFRLKDYEFFLSGLVAQAFNAEGDVQLRLALKSYH
ncbi:MAG TPA: hypothetical protein VF150_07605 [Thermoanaerobaculia bacterium]